MPIFNTARSHFDSDLIRARDLLTHAIPLAASVVKDDIIRAAWMMGVGAADAYFCDAYADLVARSLQAKQVEGAVNLPKRLMNLNVPVISVIRDTGSDNWRWRMAARDLIDDKSVLSIENMRDLFNQFCRGGHKLFSSSNLDDWITHRDARNRLFGISATNYRKLSGKPKSKQRDSSIDQFESRYATIFQRRHDCIHNCDRPRVALNSDNLTSTYVAKVLDDIEFLVSRFEDVLKVEFPEVLKEVGFSGTTRARVLQ